MIWIASRVKIIFLNRFFHPDHSATSQMLSDLAFALAAQGECVVIITSRLRYDSPKAALPARETTLGVEIHRVWTSRFGRPNLVGRSLDYATFHLSAALALWRLARKGDVVVAKTDPPMLSVIAAPITRLRGAKLVNWLQDIYPEVAEALGASRARLSSLAYGVMRWLRNRSLRQGSLNIALGEHMATRLAATGVAPDRVRIIPNWADGTLLKPVGHADNALRQHWRLAGNFVVGYSGNLGRAHECATLLDAITHLEAQLGIGTVSPTSGEPALDAIDGRGPQIVWLFVGGGALYETFKRDVIERRLSTVRFEPYQPRERLAESLSAADVHLVSLLPALEGLIVPSKFYGVAAVARPAIFIGDSDGEIARLLARHSCGITVTQGDAAGLAQTVLDLSANPARCREMGSNARRTFEAEFDKGIAVRRWQQLLAELETGRCSGLPEHKALLNAPD